MVATTPVPSDYKKDLQVFETRLMGFIEGHGLPTTNVLVPVVERVKVFGNVEDVLELLPHEHKRNSLYISKFIAASGSGLFDAALNYLWDETIFELRKRVARYDLDYFFDLAVTNPDKRKKLSSEEDLSKLDDNELIRGASEIGLISDLGFRHLDFIRYMRNWASAAHPNQNQITGLQLISWFETCVREVITLPESSATAQIKSLLANVKAHQLVGSSASQVSSFFPDLTADQINNLMAGFFGLYTNEQSVPMARDNVRLLAPQLWPLVSEPTKKNFGTKYGQYLANNDATKAALAREFLDGLGAASYIPDNIRAAEIGTAVDELLSAHRGMNNFHLEPSFARRLESLIGTHGLIPDNVAEKYIEGVTEAFLTNGHGIAWSADPIYQKLLSLMDGNQALIAALSFRKAAISSKLQFTLPQQKYRELTDIVRPKITSPQAVEIISIIDNWKHPLQNMKSETTLMAKVTAITRSLGY